MQAIDLNGDLGESYGKWQLGNDEQLLRVVTSANIACGFHAGDPHVMKRTVALAAASGTSIGAHPGYPDLNGFGRRQIALSADEIYDIIIYQVGAMAAFAHAEHVRLTHVKPHGALYNAAAVDFHLAMAVARAVRAVDPELILYGLSGSRLIEAGQSVGLRTASEVFADRTYRPDGTLTPRSESGALIADDHAAVRQVLDMVQKGAVQSTNGATVPIRAETLCIHGDGIHAIQLAKKIRRSLSDAGIAVRPLRP